jgi:hypothetical protein
LELIMRVKQLFTLTVLALAGSAVLADEAPGAPLTRAEVVQSVLAARAAGALHPAGEGPQGPGYPQAGAATSTLTRAQMKAEVLQARAAGTLPHAGSVAPEEEMVYAQAHPSTSTLTRAQVKAEVLQARANGELVPAGEAEYSAMGPIEHTTRTAASTSQHPTVSGAN